MCQIIHKVKNYSLPFDLLNSTCITNPDGFGIMMFDGKKVIADKVYTGKDNNPAAIAEFLQDLHEEEAFVHFRYKTKGAIGTASCHPFKIYDCNDREVFLMHNGTFNEYGSATKVDSEEFGEEVVAPLYDTFLRSGSRNPLQDKFFKQIVDRFSNAGSKVVLMDNTGDYLISNAKAGEIYEDKEQNTKFWVSNTYSFNRYHRGGTVWSNNFRGNGGTAYGGSSKSVVPFNATTKQQASSVATGAQTGATSVPTVPTGQATTDKEIGTVPKRTSKVCYWKDILELDDIDEVLDMTSEDINDLVDVEPEHAKLFIKDLIYEIYCLMYTNSDVSEEIDANEDTEEIENPVVTN